MAAKTIIFTFLICQFVINISFGQDWCDTVIANIKGKRLLSEIQPEVGIIKENAYVFSDKKMEFGVETVSGICSGNTLDSLKHGLFFFFSVYSKNDSIYIIDVATSKKGADVFKPFPKFTLIDTVAANQILAQHNAKYFSSWQISDYFKGLDTNLNYQSAVGFLLPPISVKDLLSALVKAKDHKALTKYTSSIHPEIRAFGSVGLYFMKLDGEKLSVFEENLIALNQGSDIMIGEIQNTIEFMMDYLIDEKMSEVLSNGNLEHCYQYFKTL